MAVSEKNIAKFINKWHGRGKEKQDDQAYWTDLLSYIFELTDITNRIEPQKDVIGPDGNTKWIDIYIAETRVLIEQKSLNIELDKPQAGHNGMTPYEQAKMYDNCLVRSEKARWIVTSNFAEIWIYDMEAKKPEDTVVKVSLDNLQREYKKLSFLYDPRVEQIKREFEISKEAGDEIGKIYDALIKQYPEKPTDDDLKNLNTFCVRLVFCYYAEDAGLFEDNLFSNYISSFNPQHLRNGLKELFRILNTPESEREPFEEPSLLAFPYVNGGLFDGKNNIIPQFDEATKNILIEAADFNWSDISPTIFGAIFESTLNQETRRKNGMHYTAIENIHKVIDPLFLNDLKTELAEIKSSKQPNVRNQKLHHFQDKLAALTFLDPACGSGNFLTETYLSLRRLENEVIEEFGSTLMLTNGEDDTLIKVQLNQFFGIEINDFAVSVARTALWIAENQMMNKTKEIIYNADTLNFLPLKSFTNIKEANALRIDWNDVLSASKCNYIIGNPPFSGARVMTKKAKDDVYFVFGKKSGAGDLDYVACWYKIAASYMKNTNIKAALVSTNSICQGIQPALLWKDLFAQGIRINFAYRTFRWDSESNIKAHVHCIIVGFSYDDSNNKVIYDNDLTINANYINSYLLDMDDTFLTRSTEPICDISPVSQGVIAVDHGYLTLTKADRDEILKKEPNLECFIKSYIGTEELINKKERYCLWLKDSTPAQRSSSAILKERIAGVKKFRSESDRTNTNKGKDTPHLFEGDFDCNRKYLVIPRISSEKRLYLPISFIDENIIPSDKLYYMPDASLYDFGILISKVHLLWIMTTSGKLETRIIYSNEIVYNNFPWPTPTKEQKASIEKCAQSIIDARALYPDSSLKDLYDSLTMPPELRKAHMDNDKAVMRAYGFSLDMEDLDIISELMKKYQGLISE